MHWIVESNVFSEECFDRMIKHLEIRGINHDIIRIVPFAHNIEGKIPEVNGPVVCYGSIGIQKVAEKHNWFPGVFSIPDEATFNKKLKFRMLNYQGLVLPINEVMNYVKGEFFIKPNTDSKEFAGTIMHSDEFTEWYQKMLDIGYLDNNVFDVMISPPKKVGREWRLVVCNGEIIAYSLYKNYQKVYQEESVKPEVLEYVLACDKIYSPALVYVIDIVETDSGLKVIEYNTFNSAGFYKCNVENIIDKVTKVIMNHGCTN